MATFGAAAQCTRRARSTLMAAGCLLTVQPRCLAGQEPRNTSRRAREFVLKVFVSGELVRGNGTT